MQIKLYLVVQWMRYHNILTLDNGSIPQPPLHPLPRTQMFLWINNHDILATLIFLVFISGLVIIGVIGHVRRGSAELFVNIFGLSGGN